ncbi:MAG: polysaccharide biosynthesis C-terminal domain-containing protein [Flavobacteriaceae bacterium]|nr:polysaccharide biosynthesis C-terminal domain-containing protein [Flavobacteriaceae bacterium]
MWHKLKQYLKNPLIVNLLIVGGITLGVKILGMFKEMQVGSSFGMGQFLDTYALAVLIPTFIESVFIGAIRNIFIPNYIEELRNKGNIKGFQSLVLLIIVGICLFFIGILFFSSQYFLPSIFPDHELAFYALIHKQLLVLLPCILLWGLDSYLSALLEIKQKFLFSSVSAAYIAIVTLLCLYFFRDVMGDYVLVGSMLIGTFFSFIHLLSGNLYWKLLHFGPIKLNNNMRVMLQQLPAKTISGLLTAVNPVVDQFFASSLVAGSVIALSYGEKIPAFMISIAMIALGKVLLPHFSELVTENIHKAYRELFRILKITFLLSMVLVVGLVLLSEPIIQLLFERNEFTTEDTAIVSKIQMLLLLHVPFFLLTRILVNFLTSINKNSFMAWAAFITVFTNFILNYLLIDSMQVYGLALSTSLVLILNSLLFLWYTYDAYKKLKPA